MNIIYLITYKESCCKYTLNILGYKKKKRGYEIWACKLSLCRINQDMMED